MIRSHRRGNAAYTVVIMMTLLSFGALVVDVGHARKARAELQNACDAGVHAGVSYLDYSDAGVTTAEAVAVQLANANSVGNGSPGVTTDDVVTGVWDGTTFVTSTDAAVINALRIDKAVTTSVFFGQAAFGVGNLVAGASAIAMVPEQNSTQSDCFLPLAIPDCRFALEQDDDTIMSTTFQMTSANADNIAWALPQSGNPNASAVRDYIEDGFCSDTSAMEDEVVSLNSGAMADAFRSMRDALEASGTTWDTERWGAIGAQPASSAIAAASWGKTIEGPIMMFAPTDPNYCLDEDENGIPDGTAAFNEDDMEITGIAWAVLYDVKLQGGGGGAGAAGNLKMKVDLEYEYQGSGGDGDYGTGITSPGNPWIVK